MEEMATIPMDEYKRLKELDEAIGKNMIRVTLSNTMEFSFVTYRTVTYQSVDKCMDELKEHILKTKIEASELKSENDRLNKDIDDYKEKLKGFEILGDVLNKNNAACRDLKKMSIFQFLKWRRE